MIIKKIKIDDIVLHDLFKANFMIDKKEINLCFNLRYFTCSVYVREAQICTIDLEIPKIYDGFKDLTYFNKTFTPRQQKIFKNKIKKCYYEILKIKFENICKNNNNNNNNMYIEKKQIDEYERYRKIIDKL